MKKERVLVRPVVVSPEDDMKVLFRLRGTPVVVKGCTWLPLAELGGWGILSWLIRRKHPDWGRGPIIRTGFYSMVVILGSEWCHNFSHLLAASLGRKPMDALRISWGMPLCSYDDVNDQEVEPLEHITRAVGGPVFNLVMVPITFLLRKRTKTGSPAREVADYAFGMNAFLSTVSLMPIPGIDGGPILKWSLVESGLTIDQADHQVRQTNGVLSTLIAGLTGYLIKMKRWFWGALAAQFTVLTFLIAKDWLKEQQD